VGGSGEAGVPRVAFGNPGDAFGCEAGLVEGMPVGLARLDGEPASVLMRGHGKPVAALFEDDLVGGQVGNEVALLDAQNLCHLAEALGGLSLDKAVNEINGGLLLLNDVGQSQHLGILDSSTCGA